MSQDVMIIENANSVNADSLWSVTANPVLDCLPLVGEAETEVAVVGIGYTGLTKPNHPWTNGQVERMNRAIKYATVKRYHYDNHDQLRSHLSDFLDAYNYARRPKTVSGLTPYEYNYKIWTSEPDRFIPNPIH